MKRKGSEQAKGVYPSSGTENFLPVLAPKKFSQLSNIYPVVLEQLFLAY